MKKGFDSATQSGFTGSRRYKVRQEEVQREVKTYLTALVSYPQRFAQEPGVSFEQHLVSIAAGKYTVQALSRAE